MILNHHGKYGLEHQPVKQCELIILNHHGKYGLEHQPVKQCELIILNHHGKYGLEHRPVKQCELIILNHHGKYGLEHQPIKQCTVNQLMFAAIYFRVLSSETFLQRFSFADTERKIFAILSCFGPYNICF